MSARPFVPDDFDPPLELELPDFHLVPLGVQHNASDHAAWMASIEHIRATPGFPDGSWPSMMTPADNLRDLERHAEDFRWRRGFTYTVLDPSGDVIGCVYIYPSRDEDVDAEVQSWVSVDRREHDRPLYEAVRDWLRRDWPFEVVEYAERVPQ